MSFDPLSKAGMPPTNTAVDPGAQGDDVAGMQGDGENMTGKGLIVAGLAGLLQMAKGIMFTMGALSIIVAMGAVAITLRGNTVNADGADPKGHINCAPLQTH